MERLFKYLINFYLGLTSDYRKDGPTIFYMSTLGSCKISDVRFTNQADLEDRGGMKSMDF